uniref:Membrane spanning 4-domains A3 n=1 Tax=Oryctolagus cuniculus TaxID=9986 RepID=A0A5F9CXG0_RABIT
MASQEVDKALPETASAAGFPGSPEPEGVSTSSYQSIEESNIYQKGELQALGFISSGSLSVAAGRKPTRMLMQNSFGMNIASAIIGLVGVVFLSLNLAINSNSLKSCQSSQSLDLCIYMGSTSNGLVSLMLILTLLELCITTSISIMWSKAKCCASRPQISSPSDSVESGIPPDESHPDEYSS